MINLLKIFIFSFISLLLFSGCAGIGSKLSEEQCAMVDWRQLGFNEGEAGRAQRNLAREIKTCNNHGIEIDTSQYVTGWNDGISRYCVTENGYNLGRINKKFPNVCPDSLQMEFRNAYDRGFTNYRRVKELKKLVKYINRSLDRDTIKIRKLEKYSVKNDAREIKSQIDQLEAEEHSLKQTGKFDDASKTALQIDKLSTKYYLDNAKESRSQGIIKTLRKTIARLHKDKRKFEEELKQIK